jgi:hypothetical protein
MVLTLRDFEITAEYEEWDRLSGKGVGETPDGRDMMFGT